MKRRRASQNTRCVVLRTGEPSSAYRCLPPEEAERRVRSGSATAVPGGEYDSEEECEARCNVLLSLPQPAVEAVMRQVPVARLGALGGVSRAVGAPTVGPLAAERAARDEVFRTYPAARATLVEDLCAQWWLPCVQPYTEMAARLARRLALPLGEAGEPVRIDVQSGTRWYDPVDGADLAAINPEFVGRPDAPAVRELPDARDVPVLLPGESIVVTGASGVIGAPLLLLPRYPIEVPRTADGLLAIQLILSGSEITGAPTRYLVGAAVRYVVPPPPGVDVETLRVGEGRARRRAVGAYLAHVERVLNLVHGAIVAVPETNDYRTRSEEDQRDIWTTLSRAGFPVHEVALAIQM